MPEIGHADRVSKAEVSGSDNRYPRRIAARAHERLLSNLYGRAGNGGEAFRGPTHRVVARDNGLQSFVLYVIAVARAVHLGIVATENVADSPARVHLMHLEAILD